ncbi:NAD-dependent epimerase/dehydratase family protein [Bullifex porci]|nr:NAD-dependent epimerase/dehydratase family protein [Bullifex porci]
MGSSSIDYLKEDLLNVAEYIYQNEFSNCSILITGATGLLGFLCIKSLLVYQKKYCKNVSVYGLARNPQKVSDIFSEEELKSINIIYQDITAPLSDSLKFDYIIHTANPTTSKFFLTNPVEVIDSIYLGIKNILENALKSGTKGVVYLSSMEVFEIVEEKESRHSEKDLGYVDLQSTRSCYSEGKRLAELLCKSYVTEYNLPVRIARLAQTFGAGVQKSENRVFAQFLRSAIYGEDIVLHTKGQSFGNYCYTADVIRALFLLPKRGEAGDVFNIVNEDSTVSIAEMAQMVAHEFSNGKSKVIFDIPTDNVYGYAPDTKLKLSNEKMAGNQIIRW